MKLNKKKIWCSSLGTKIDENCIASNDYACYLRTVYAIIMIITSMFIIGNAIHQW